MNNFKTGSAWRVGVLEKGGLQLLVLFQVVNLALSLRAGIFFETFNVALLTCTLTGRLFGVSRNTIGLSHFQLVASDKNSSAEKDKDVVISR